MLLVVGPILHLYSDMIFIERDNLADVAYRVWRLFATARGRLIPDDKSPPPYFVFRALGLLDT